LSAQILDRVLRCYRIGDPDGRFPIFDAQGSRIAPGRWNGETTPVIYAGEHYSTAMLEKLAHFNGLMPKNQHFIEITIPTGVSYEMFNPPANPGWETAESPVARLYGEGWVRAARSAVLIVPSVVARMEHNYVLNPAHADFARITASLHQPIWWDDRLFR
jgi:RES domain-containing protein